MRNGFVRAAGLIHLSLAAMILLAAETAAGCAEMTGFRVGIAAPTVNMLPLWVAQQAGLFKARGLDVQIVNTDGGSRGLAEVGAGRLQAMMVGLSSVIDANDKGGDYRLIASGANTMSFRFFGARGTGTAAALKGRKVGVSTFGSESDSAAIMALKRLGLSRDDVQLVEAGGTLKRLAALQSGALAATALNEPADTEAETRGASAAGRSQGRSAMDFHRDSRGPQSPCIASAAVSRIPAGLYRRHLSCPVRFRAREAGP